MNKIKHFSTITLTSLLCVGLSFAETETTSTKQNLDTIKVENTELTEQQKELENKILEQEQSVKAKLQRIIELRKAIAALEKQKQDDKTAAAPALGTAQDTADKASAQIKQTDDTVKQLKESAP